MRMDEDAMVRVYTKAVAMCARKEQGNDHLDYDEVTEAIFLKHTLEEVCPELKDVHVWWHGVQGKWVFDVEGQPMALCETIAQAVAKLTTWMRELGNLTTVEQEAQKQWPGFMVTCDKCGGRVVELQDSIGFSAESGGWGGLTFDCINCDNRKSIFSVY